MSNNQKLLDTYFAKREVLLRFLTGLARDRTTAEDILQDLYLKISMARVETDIADPLSFLFKAANNLFLNRLRAASSRQVRDKAWHAVRSGDAGTESDDVPNAEAIVSGRQELHAVLRSLLVMPQLTQTIFRLHKLEGLSQTDVARQLDISISSVEKHLSRALQHLLNSRPSIH